MGLEAFGMDFSGLSAFFNTDLEKQLSGIDLSGIAYMQELIKWIDTMTSKKQRERVAIKNFRQAYKFLSQEAAAHRLLDSVQCIYERHRPKISQL
jgi:hypothetical protein